MSRLHLTASIAAAMGFVASGALMALVVIAAAAH